MKSPLQEFSDELDDLIKNGSSIGVFDLPADYIENLEVEVICSTYIEYDGMHFILKVSVVSESAELVVRHFNRHKHIKHCFHYSSMH